MKYLPRLLVLLLTFITLSSAKAQTYTALNAHSHNDYKQAVPFLHAYSAGFGAIEADIFKVNGQLLVAHNDKELNAELTLKKLYLNPIAKALAQDPTRKLTLLIDLKQEYFNLMPALITELKPLKKLCRSIDNPNGQLFILISGNRPPPGEFNKYPDYIYFDEDLLHVYNANELKRIGQISLRYTNYSKWKGMGTIPTADEARLVHLIDSVHTLGKPIRFWDAPDNAAGWSQLIKAHADIIGTDKIDELAAFLKGR